MTRKIPLWKQHLNDDELAELAAVTKEHRLIADKKRKVTATLKSRAEARIRRARKSDPSQPMDV
ncbi:MAG: hypothetical protein KDA50_10575 [Rhodobacteraceae bacterium]|nr:hypothetical protein [Paracoccaceae bacterium]